jgi:hypothetical protein
MNYKTWTDEELIRQGKRLAAALPKAKAYLRVAPQNTYPEIYQLMKDIEAVNLGEYTLKLLRDEYTNRKSKHQNPPA